MSTTIINPLTGKKILINGPTYNKLLKNNKISPPLSKYSPKISINSLHILSYDSALSNKKIIKLKKLDGCSSFGKYTSKDAPFCGPKGKACKGTYPVNTKKRMLSAVRYSRNAPNPKGIVSCAVRVGLTRNYITEEKARQILERYKFSPSTINKIISSPKKTSVKKTSVKKSPKKNSVKKTSVKKSPKKNSVKKTSVKKSPKKNSVKKSPKKNSVKKTSVKKSPKKNSVKKTSVKKSPKKTSVKKSPKKNSVKKTSVKKTSVKKSPKKTSVKKNSVKKSYY
jgi:hypothetical protein